MALTVNGTNTFTASRAANFIPELWLDEVIAARDANLVATKCFRAIPHNGKKGDTLHIPNVSHLTANDKAANATVTIQAPAETDVQISLNKHKEASVFIEDFTEAQENYMLRKIYTKQAGYALAVAHDTDLLTAVTGGITNVLDGDGTAVTNAGVALTYAGIVEADYYLNASDVPEEERFMIIHPIHRKTILTMNNFIMYDYSGKVAEDIYRKGAIGEIMGYKVFMSTNMPNTAKGAVTNGYVILMGHESAAASAVQKAPRMQAQYMQQYLSTLLTADTIYGVKTLRADHCVGLRTPIS